MDYFDDQIKERQNSDNKAFQRSMEKVAQAVMGETMTRSLTDWEATKGSLAAIFEFFHVPCDNIPDDIQDRNEQLEYIMQPYGIMRRTVNLEKGWYKNAHGAMMGVLKSTGRSVALIPGRAGGYFFVDPATGKRQRVRRGNETLFETEAMCFYQPLPQRALGFGDLLVHMFRTINARDVAFILLSTALVTLVGLFLPKLNNMLFGDVLSSGSARVLIALASFILAVTVSQILLGAIKGLFINRISMKMSLTVESSTMLRVLSLPVSFFKKYTAGELASRAQYVKQLSTAIADLVMSTGITSLFSLVYLTQIFAYAPGLMIPAILVLLVTIVLSAAATLLQMRITRQNMQISAKENGMSYALISGIQKIKIAGAEKRAFSRWAELYSQEAKLIYNPPMFLKVNSVLTTAVSLAGTLIIYAFAVDTGVSVADYFAFNSAYGMTAGAFTSMASMALSVANIRPILEMVKPLLDEVPEVSEGKSMVQNVTGRIELSHVTFRYEENMPPVIDDLSLNIRKGEYVAIVGETGCGKSTLVRLLLGFEKPQKGAVSYDGRDISVLDAKSLRRKIGVVMQNGKLLQGDIFSNITISAPWLSMDDAWEAAKVAGIAGDIEEMPMGMKTYISEGSGGISGGQKQRLLIARAVAPKPKVLILDEATSALDNITQKKVSEALDGLKCTRIVIAHRLSTIRQCDRILFLKDGHIVEDGTYDSLIAKDGYFAKLVERQRIDAGN